jgi:hypothetical protein
MDTSAGPAAGGRRVVFQPHSRETGVAARRASRSRADPYLRLRL